MNVQDVKVICICFNILPEFHTTGIPFKYCSNIDELNHAIDKCNRYKIILVCDAEHVQQLYDIILSRNIRKVYIYGNYPETKIGNTEITVVNMDVRKLMLFIIASVMNYIHDEEITQRNVVRNNETANERAKNIVQLTELMETLYRNSS